MSDPLLVDTDIGVEVERNPHVLVPGGLIQLIRS